MPERLHYCPQCAAPLAMAEHGGFQRLGCTRCDFVFWDNPIPVVAAIVEHEGKIVLGRNALWPPGMFALITGFMEKADDTPDGAVLREVEEELGLHGKVAGFVGHYRFHRMNQIIMAYHVRATGHIRLDPELVEYRHVAPQDLHPWPGATGDALRDWMLARGLTPLPYEAEPLKLIPGYVRIGGGLAAGGRPQPVQFKALGMARTQAVVTLGAARDAERDAAQGSGMRYFALAVDADAPNEAMRRAVADQLAALSGQRVYIYAATGDASRTLALLYAAAHLDLPADRLQRLAAGVRAPAWATYLQQQLALRGSRL
ncbi:MAG TPA: NUDIX domain-containing protein [Nevskiaceae bacterium]|nr:NUDIX domain-containing protein [Nevskiaceae bacterium]